MPGGGGGADLDMVTAGKPDVLVGKVIVDKDGEPLNGTMVNRGAVSQALGVNGTYTIPEGYHNGSGKVTQSIATMGGQTVNPMASQQIVSTNGKYLTGNVTVNGVSNLTAANIKKGVNVGGTVGTFSGYVATATDLYLRGNNIRGWTSGTASFDTGQISLIPITGRTHYLYVNNINFTGYRYLNIEGYIENGSGITKTVQLHQVISGSSYNTLGYLDLQNYGTGQNVYTFDLTSHQISANIRLTLYQMDGAIYRIWLS